MSHSNDMSSAAAEFRTPQQDRNVYFSVYCFDATVKDGFRKDA